MSTDLRWEEWVRLDQGKRKRVSERREQHMQKLFQACTEREGCCMGHEGQWQIQQRGWWAVWWLDANYRQTYLYFYMILWWIVHFWVSSVLNTHTKPDSWRANKVWYEYDFTWYTWKNDFCHVRFACHSKSKCYRFNAKERLELYAVSRWAE